MSKVRFLKILPNFAGVILYSFNFEEVLSCKAQLAAINWQISLITYDMLSQIRLSRIIFLKN